jgi:hypothetical protein
MSELGDAYQNQIGANLAAIAWRPMTCDTPGLVSDLNLPVLRFSGGVSLFFVSGGIISLTWANKRECYLALAKADAWSPFALDCIHWSAESPWSDLADAKLEGVKLFRDSLGTNEVVAALHEFSNPAGSVRLWVGVGREHRMQEGDDLLVLLGQDPANRSELALLETIGCV